eukprot:361693-Chlamydomonas_euryale.AAC.2
MAFCKDFNARTANHKEGTPLRVTVRVYADKSHDWALGGPPATWLIKRAAGLERASMRPGHEAAGVVSLKHLYAIAQLKAADAPGMELRPIVTSLLSTCRSMGVRVVSRPQDVTTEVLQEV